MKGMKNLLIKKMPTVLTLLFLVVLGGAIVGLSGTIKAQKERMTEEKLAAVARERVPVNVVLLNVSPTTIQDRINLPGVIEPWEKLNVMSKINGTVLKIEVSEGDTVAKGQVIARLDPDDYRIALDSARASHDLANAKYNRLKSLFDQDIVPEAELENLAIRYGGDMGFRAGQQRAQLADFEGAVAKQKATGEAAKSLLTGSSSTAQLAGKIK